VSSARTEKDESHVEQSSCPLWRRRRNIANSNDGRRTDVEERLFEASGGTTDSMESIGLNAFDAELIRNRFRLASLTFSRGVIQSTILI
jgi:hypothetical protein